MPMLVGLSLQTYFSVQHIQAAAYLARRAERLERRLTPSASGASVEVVVKGYASSALFTTVAFLDALVNELFADAAKPNGGHLAGLDRSTLRLIANLGQVESVQKAQLMSRFDLLLGAAGLPPVAKGCYPAQDLSAAIRLRNELVHYKAEWFDVGTEGMARPGNFLESKLAQQIRGRFLPRRGAGPGVADGWLGGGCAHWAIGCAVAYTDQVFKKLGVAPLYEHVRSCVSRRGDA